MEPKGVYLPLAILSAAGKAVRVEENGEVRFKQPANNVIGFKNWLFVYHQKSYDLAGGFLENLRTAMKTFKISVDDPEWVEINSNNPRDWVTEIESREPNKKSFILIFVLDLKVWKTSDQIYREITIDSLSKKGYISQGIKSYTSKKGLSIATKVGLQINAKL